MGWIPYDEHLGNEIKRLKKENEFLKKQIKKRRGFCRYLLNDSKMGESLFINMYHQARRWQGKVFMLRKALKLALEWLDEVTNPDNEDMRTEEGVGVRLIITTAIEQSKR